MRGKALLALLLAVVFVFASGMGLEAQASQSPDGSQQEGNDSYVWKKVGNSNTSDVYYVCVDMNGRAVMMLSDEIYHEIPQDMENGYVYIKDEGDPYTKCLAVVDRSGDIVSTFCSRANERIVAYGYGYIMAVETPNSSGFDMTATGTCRYKLYDPEGQVVFEREYEGSGEDLPVYGQYYGGGVFSLGSEFYFSQTGVTADLSGINIDKLWLSFYEGPWCLSRVKWGDELVLLVMNTSGNWWTEEFPAVLDQDPYFDPMDQSRGLIWKETQTWYSYDVSTRQWYALEQYGDRVRKVSASIDRIGLTMRGDDGKDYFAIYDSQWNMISPEPTLGSVIDIWDGTALIQTDTYNEETIIDRGAILNVSDKVMCLYDAQTGQQRPGMLYGNVLSHYDSRWGSGNYLTGSERPGEDFYWKNGLLRMDDSDGSYYDTEGNFLFSATGIDYSQYKDITWDLQNAWEVDSGKESAFVSHLATTEKLYGDSSWQPALEHGGQYPVPDGFQEDWYLDAGDMTFITDDYDLEIGLWFEDMGDGTFMGMMLPVLECEFQANNYEGTPDGGVYYAGDCAEMYYYPEHGSVYILASDGQYQYEFKIG